MSWDSPQSIEDQRNEYLSDDEMTWIDVISKSAEAVIFHINTIEQVDDLELIKLSIDAIQELDSMMATMMDDETRDIKIDIRNGEGDFKDIQQKCIDLGVV